MGRRFLAVVWCKDVTGWSQTLYIGKDYLDLLSLLPPPLDGWDCTGAWFNATQVQAFLHASQVYQLCFYPSTSECLNTDSYFAPTYSN